MENSLHTQKVAILSRLIKESSLTLEEALLLLKEEDVQESVQKSVQPTWIGTTTPYIQPYMGSTGTITFNNTGVSTTTTAFTPSSTFTADLNN